LKFIGVPGMIRKHMKPPNLQPRFCLVAAFVALVGQAAEFPAVYNSEQNTNAFPPSPQESLAKLKLPPGFNATVFAAEPDVQNPIAMAWDARGRLWIAENYTYAERSKKFDLQLRDRILIFEDKDNDGRFDSRIVFTEEAQRLTSIEIGRDGVWVMCPPQFFSFLTRTVMTCRMARRKSSWTGSEYPQRIITTSPTVCGGDLTDGFTDAVVHRQRARSVCRVRRRRRGCRCVVASGVTTRLAKLWRC